ncbi:DUF898 family protein [Streptococcus sp. DD12]|uniref:DUF898 family protein n=1 Tax=Streptococcus sp. DD12 TaxID=1777880 RepID=UPI00079AA17D|nr:DUF898 family protein [Streptococcus sp. DD12]KXT76600.1 hypothetical protein STRDD12_00480 [Streptococcus sp. DD12]
MYQQSYFDGGLLSYIGHSIIAGIMITFSLGLATPWAICWMQKWKAQHTVIDGHRLYFDGTGGQLFGNWIKWTLLTLITIGIYAFWLNIKKEQWITKHTHQR